MRATVACVIALACVACTRPHQATPPAVPEPTPEPRAVAEPRPPTVVRVRFSGARRLTWTRLREAISTRSGQALSPAAVRDDLRAIYAIGGVTDVRATAEAVGEGVEIEFAVREAPVVGAVAFTGNRRLGDDELRELAAVRIGAPLDPAAITRGKNAIARRYRAVGHYAARVSWRHAERGGAAAIDVDIDEGPRGRVTRVDFPGARSIGRGKLRTLFATPSGANRSGRLYAADAVDRGRWRILSRYYDRGYLDAVVGAAAVRADGRRVAIRVPVSEGDRYRLGEVTVTGDLAADAAAYQGVHGLRAGRVFQRSKVGDAIARLASFHRARSGCAASVTPVSTVDPVADTVGLEFRIAQACDGERRAATMSQ